MNDSREGAKLRRAKGPHPYQPGATPQVDIPNKKEG